MRVRNYRPEDEQGWLRCRVISFLDTSYYDDVLTEKESCENEAICLVAEEAGEIVGLLDIELEDKVASVCVAGDRKGAVIWHLAVLPEYRRKHVAASLWSEGKKLLKEKGITYCEVWTQEDKAANSWYRAEGFHNLMSHNWLRCYIRPSDADRFLNKEAVGEIYGVDELIFKATTDRRQELASYCYRIEEVRLYAVNL